jgi:hypothetical protein
MKSYYTDNEIIDSIDSKEIAEIVRKRFEQKDNQRDWLQRRVNVAAEHMGHQLITDLLEDQY